MVHAIRNNQGIALVTSLMLTLISLTIVMALLYIVAQGIRTSGQNRRYRTAVEASYGGAEIMVKDIIPVMMQNYSSGTFSADVQTSFSGVGLQVLSGSKCMQSKLVRSTADWPSSCSSVPNPKVSPDMRMTLQATSGSPFIVTSKIVDTVAGNSDTSGLQLEGSGVAESSSLLTPKSIPYIYRVEIQGERQSNSTSQANVEVVYAY
jgi:hypothetical protein